MDFDNLKLKQDTPYPSIENAKPCKRTVAILKDLLSDRYSELTAIFGYTYQSVIADPVDEKIARIFEELAIVEMGHAELLSKAILSFGGNPEFDNAEGKFFSTGYVKYNTKLKDMLDDNILSEQMAVEAYTEASKNVENASLKQLLLRIAEDEKFHVEALKQIRSSVKFLSA